MKSIIRVVLLFLIAVAVFTTCDSPMGMGDQIDWEPPILTMDPVPNPYYVRQKGSVLTGTVTDNIGVERVLFINSANGDELFPVTRNGDNWLVELLFTEEQNGQKIVAQVIAFDKMGNTGASSSAFVTLIIDITPPIIEYMDIKRTDSRMATIARLSELQALEDANGNPSGRKADLYKYQNGWFYINGIVSDKDTKVQVISLEFHDYNYNPKNTLLISLGIDEGYTPYFPRWTVKEEDIINAGVNIFGDVYKTDYYVNKKHYYYKVVIKALDMSENASDIIEEDEGFICLWAESDEPKGIVDSAGIGIIDPVEGLTISRGTPIPVDFYDDDSLLWAYTGLLTEDQWKGLKSIYSDGTTLPTGSYVTDDERLLFLKNRLTGNQGADADSVELGTAGEVYNWKYDKHSGESDEVEKIEELVKTSNIDEKLVYVATGNLEGDYGKYILFTLTADKKLTPHSGSGPELTNKNMWKGRAERVQVIDENAPLIVMDTSAGCPEENTFPDPLKDADDGYGNPAKEQKYFYMIGYTLRENKSGLNSVVKFRMAWIPYGMNGGPDKYIPEVKEALRNDTFAGMPDGVQYWNFNPGVPGTGEGKLNDESPEIIDVNTYKKQSFKIRFSVMGDADALKPGVYRNFTYNTKLENETKLFICYAMDNMGHEVFRQYRLLGYREEPNLNVYDITNRFEISSGDLPNPTDTGNTDPSSGSPTKPYYDALKTYNETTTVYNAIKSAATSSPGLTDKEIQTIPFQLYPRNTVLKFYVNADNTGKIPIETITMQDITFKSKDEAPFVGSGYKSADVALSFCEFYPDVTSRTFLFIAKDKLGNEKQIQRAISVTNAARLERITTTTQNGTYGIGTKITLRAEFSGLIYVKSGAPQLYVRYTKSGSTVYEPLSLKSTPTYANPATALEFEFEVKENYKTDKLETMYENLSSSGGAPDKHPLTLNGAEIMDYNRQDSAFIPGYVSNSVTMPNWTTDKDTLQSKKTIKLDGERPTITSVAWGGKGNPGDDLYFKNGETITLTVTSGKNIRAQGDSTFQYYIRDRVTNGTKRGPYIAEFKYQRPGPTKNILIYSLTVTSGSCPNDGRLEDVTLYTPNADEAANYIGIVDDVGNSVVKTAVTGLLPQGNTKISVKQTKPAAPAATLSNTNAGYTNEPFQTATRENYNGVVNFNIPEATGNFADWEDKAQYSTTGGISWNPPTLPSAKNTPLPGSVPATPAVYNVQTRYVDRAGNEGEVRSKRININDTFPSLISVNTVQANGTYRGGSNLTFNLNFADTVTVKTPGSVSITLKNRAGTTTASNEQTITLSAAQNNVATVVFNWNNIQSKEMRDGLYISSINLSGLEDKYGISGPTASITGNYNGTNFTGHASVTGCANLAAGVIVDAIAPTVNGRTPAIGNPSSGTNSLVKTLTLTFSEPVMKGSGTITIRPRGEYAIPAVLEDTGYYLGYTSNGQTGGTEGESQPVPTKFQTAGANRTYISSFYDIYNSLGTTDRTSLTQGSSMSDLTLNVRTGQSAGPYKKTTQGLVTGFGYLANYSGTNVTSGASAPNANGYTALIPDTATKWVLDYQYPISVPSGSTAALNTQRLVVDKIRIALTNAKWRWQEIDVVTAAVSGNTATITLNEPLLKGLAWDVYYPSGTFTDLAGNPAPASGTTATDKMDWTNSDYYFTSPGVQAPVIRVNRRSSDSRDGVVNNVPNSWKDQKSYSALSDTSGWNANTIVVSDSNGWGSGNFNYIHYRVETESSVVGGTVDAYYYKGVADNANRTAAKGSFTGADVVQTTNYTPADLNIPNNTGITGSNYTGLNARTWAQAQENTAGTWVTPNIVFRSQNQATQTYTVVTKNGTSETRTSTNTSSYIGQNQTFYPLRMYKSYNRDLRADELGYPTGSASVTLTQASLSSANDTINQGLLSFRNTANNADSPYEASKSYIVGTASLNGVSNKGVEGIFRTVIMLNHSASRPANFMAIEGSNIKNGMPSVAGFPLRDADEYDCRFLKVCFDVSPTGTPRTQLYWVSTEIVCEWYFIGWGGGTANSTTNNGTHMNIGEVNNYIMVGYGDLTYVYDVHMSNQ